MLPLRDLNPTRRLTWVTVLLVGLNVAVYFLVQPGQTETSATVLFNFEHAAIPCEVTTGRSLTPAEIIETVHSAPGDHCHAGSRSPEAFPKKSVYLAVLLSMFFHGSVLHLAGNMLFLWIFGNNIEDRLGSLRYLVLYLVAGLVAAAAHIAVQPHSTVPVLGASGAIAGVMGAYLVWFPNARIVSLFFFLVVEIRAKWWLGVWFVEQFFVNPNVGVAWVAHVGGFVFGVLAALALRPVRRRPGRRDRPPSGRGWGAPGAGQQW
ncbi:MAG: rhomboid family intramembrane serine protease [Acidobacteria bacterium]|nr:rhomboid family intramembrane serine protease [Acidobacteriota bacterium]